MRDSIIGGLISGFMIFIVTALYYNYKEYESHKHSAKVFLTQYEKGRLINELLLEKSLQCFVMSLFIIFLFRVFYMDISIC